MDKKIGFESNKMSLSVSEIEKLFAENTINSVKVEIS